MRADFVANASHELRTPLASLRGFVETLQGAAKDDEQARERFLKVMSEQAERMTRLIDDLLSLSRVEMREHLPLAERVDLNDAVGHVIQALQPIAAQAGTTIEFGALDGPADVRGDRDEIVQVFQNLVQNAIKYGKTGGASMSGSPASPPAEDAPPASSWRSRTTGRASRRSTSPASPSASTASTWPPAARRAAPGSASPSSSTSSTATAASCHLLDTRPGVDFRRRAAGSD